jgi:hypothetical protein
VKKHDEQMACERNHSGSISDDLQTMMMEFIPKIESLTQQTVGDCFMGIILGIMHTVFGR